MEGGCLGQTAPALSGRPEEEAHAAAQIVLRDEAKESAVSAHGVVVAEGEIHFIGDCEAVFFHEFDIDFSLFGERWACIVKGKVGSNGS